MLLRHPVRGLLLSMVLQTAVNINFQGTLLSLRCRLSALDSTQAVTTTPIEVFLPYRWMEYSAYA